MIEDAYLIEVGHIFLILYTSPSCSINETNKEYVQMMLYIVHDVLYKYAEMSVETEKA